MAKRLPTRDTDGTLFCPSCRKRGVLSRMGKSEYGTMEQCPTCQKSTYTDDMLLTWQQYHDGADCPGCGQPLLGARHAPWHDKGTMYYTDEERAEADAEEAMFRELHPICSAGRWTISGHRGLHCMRCCPPPPLSPDQIARLRPLLAAPPRDLQEGRPSLPAPPRKPTRKELEHELEGLRARVAELEAVQEQQPET